MKEDFFLPVKKIKAEEIFPGKSFLSSNEYVVIVEIPEKNGVPNKQLIVNHCSSSYGLIPCGDLISEFEERLMGNFKFKAKYRHHDYSKFYVDYIIEDIAIHIGDPKHKDFIKPCLKLFHSYNGMLKFQVIVGFYRLKCLNGLYGFDIEKQLSFKHTTDNINLAYIETIKTISDFIEKISIYKQKFEILSSQPIPNYKERVEFIKSSLFNKFPAKAISEVLNRIKLESKTLPITDWVIYNAFNYQLNHFGMKMYDEDKIRLDKKIYELILTT